MADHEAVGAAGEAAIGDEGHVRGQAAAVDGAGGAQHLPHAGPATRPLIAHHHDIAGRHGAGHDGRHGRLLAVKHLRRALETQPFVASDLGDGAIRGQVPPQHHQMAVWLDGVREGPNDRLPRRIGGNIRQVFRQRAAGDGEAAAMQEAGVQEGFHQRPDAADGDELGHGMPPRRAHVRQHRHVGADAREIVQLKGYAGGVGDGEQMQHRVGGTFEGDAHRDGVLECLAAEDVRRLDAALDEAGDGSAGGVAVAPLVVALGVLRRGVRQRKAQRLNGGSHRVRRVHAAAGTRPRNGRLLHFKQLRIGDGIGGAGAHGLEHGDDVAPLRTRQNRAAIDEHAGPVEPRHRHRAAGHVLVATADGDEAVEALCAHHGFDGVRDDLAGHERVAHPGGAHRDAVRHGDGVEHQALGAGFVRAHRGRFGEGVDVHVARRHLAPSGGDADLWLAEILRGEADGAQHGAARRLFHAIHDDGGMFAAFGHVRRFSFTYAEGVCP